MNLRRFLIEGATLVVSAIILGLVANALAAADRKVSVAAPQLTTRQAVESEQMTGHSSSIIEDQAVTSADMDQQEELERPVGDEQPVSQPSTAQAGSKAPKSEILKRFPPSPDVPAEEIHTDDAYWLWKNGALFLDARRTSAYNEGHIAGARNFAVWEADVDEKVKNMAAEGIDPDMPVILYCSGGACEDSHMLAQKLWGMFFNNLRVYYEGYPGWTDAGYPVNKGPQP